MVALVPALSSIFLILPALVSSACLPRAASSPTATSSNPFPTELKVFEYIPHRAPADIRYKPLQFNGSFPGAGDTDEHVGWFLGENPAGQNEPVDLVSFVQRNAKEGIVFWPSNTALQIYLAPVAGHEGTYIVRNGAPQSPDELTDEFTIGNSKDGNKWWFGWKDDYDHWFVCGSKSSGFYGLYYGKHLKGCSHSFLLEAKYL